MNKENNLRAQKTQKRIKDVLLKKLGTKNLAEITVKEICKDAKINRTTFYIHYDNIYDLMLSIDIGMQKGIKELFRNTEDGTFQIITEESMEKLIAYILKHALFYRVLLNDLNRLNLLDDELSSAWEKEIEPVINEGQNLSKVELQYHFEYFNSGFRGIIRRWLNTGCQESPKELTHVIQHVVRL